MALFDSTKTARGGAEGREHRWALDAHDIAKLRELFEFFEESEGAGLTAASLRDVLGRALGSRPPLDKCREAIALWCDGNVMDFESFLSFYAARFKDMSSVEELRSVFHLLKDPRANTVPAERVVRAMRELGEAKEKKLERMFRDAFPGENARALMETGDMTFEQFSLFMR